MHTILLLRLMNISVPNVATRVCSASGIESGGHRHTFRREERLLYNTGGEGSAVTDNFADEGRLM